MTSAVWVLVGAAVTAVPIATAALLLTLRIIAAQVRTMDALVARNHQLAAALRVERQMPVTVTRSPWRTTAVPDATRVLPTKGDAHG